MDKLYDICTEYIFPSNPATQTIGSINFNITLMQWSGIPLFGAKHESQLFKLLLAIYGICVLSIVTIVYTGFEIHDLVLCWGNLDDLTQNTCLSLSHISGAFKIINLFYRRKDVLRLVEQYKYLSKTYVVSEKQNAAFYWGEFENKRPVLIYISIVIVTGNLAIIMLLLNPTDIGGSAFPFRVKLPDFLPYKIQIIYMATSIYLHAVQIAAVDCLNVTFINQIRNQMTILNLAFERLDVSDETDATDSNKHFNGLLTHHSMILKIRKETEDIFKYPLLLQFFTSVLVFAITGFQATVQSDSSKATLIYLYCSGIFFQLFAYCWFGNEVSEQNKSLASRGYNTPWYNFDQRYKTSLIIFLMNAQSPLNFTAGGFVVLSLSTFTGILGKSYSYIAFLRQIYAEK